jgi:hypothetical protein
MRARYNETARKTRRIGWRNRVHDCWLDGGASVALHDSQPAIAGGRFLAIALLAPSVLLVTGAVRQTA